MRTFSEATVPRTEHAPTRLSAIGPDYLDAKAFLDIMHPDEKVTFQTVPRDGADFQAKIVHGYLDDLWSELVEWNVRGANIYCVVNQSNGRGRSINSVKAISAFFVSVRDAPMDRLEAIPMRPHAIVLTGERSWQAHWKVQPTPVTYSSRRRAADFFRRVQTALAMKVGGDLSVTDLARCAHVPGFFTYKDEPYRVGLDAPSDAPDSELLSFVPVS